MSNAAALRPKLENIVKALDEGKANPEKTLRACVKGMILLCEDIERIETVADDRYSRTGEGMAEQFMKSAQEKIKKGKS